MNATAGRENFYVIVGSSAGALVGLQFVVITLIAAVPVTDGVAEAVGAFGTPTIVHFVSVLLLLSAILCVPWHGIGGAAIVWGLVGLSGLLYTIIVTRRMRMQNQYQLNSSTGSFIARCRPSPMALSQYPRS